jgi:hypothetical protein
MVPEAPIEVTAAGSRPRVTRPRSIAETARGPALPLCCPRPVWLPTSEPDSRAKSPCLRAFLFNRHADSEPLNYEADGSWLEARAMFDWAI